MLSIELITGHKENIIYIVVQRSAPTFSQQTGIRYDDCTKNKKNWCYCSAEAAVFIHSIELDKEFMDLKLIINTLNGCNYVIIVLTFNCFQNRKYEEIYPPEVGEFVFITDDTYTKQQVFY